MTRRRFLAIGVAILLAGGAAWPFFRRGTIRPLITDPDGDQFVYDDGWIVAK